ncbi:MAG TPA: hypothetical protein ENJ38_07385 [Rhodospirillales bacterium]|nr:hypothetical protein [Rhodospirillales bacterium]
MPFLNNPRRLDEASRQRLAAVARELRLLAASVPALDIVCHDLARIVERLSRLEDVAALDEMQVVLHLGRSEDAPVPGTIHRLLEDGDEV